MDHPTRNPFATTILLCLAAAAAAPLAGCPPCGPGGDKEFCPASQAETWEEFLGTWHAELELAADDPCRDRFAFLGLEPGGNGFGIAVEGSAYPDLVFALEQCDLDGFVEDESADASGDCPDADGEPLDVGLAGCVACYLDSPDGALDGSLSLYTEDSCAGSYDFVAFRD